MSNKKKQENSKFKKTVITILLETIAGKEQSLKKVKEKLQQSNKLPFRDIFMRNLCAPLRLL